MATYEPFALREIRYLVESEANFGINQSGSQSYKIVRVTTGAPFFQLNKEMVKNDLQQQRIDGFEPYINGLKAAVVTLPMYLYGAPTILSGTGTPADFELANLLGVVMGGHVAASGSTQSGAGSSSGSATSTHATSFRVGGVMGLLNSSGALEVVRIRDESVGVKTFANTLTFIPSTGSALYNAHNCYLAEDCSGSLQFYGKGRVSTDAFVVAGCNGTFSLETPLGQPAKINFNLNGATWFTASAGTLNNVTYVSGANFSVFSDSKVLIWQKSNSAAVMPTSLKVSSLTITPNIQYADVRSPDGVETISRKVRVPTGQPAVTVQFTIPFADRTYFESRDNQTEYGMMIQIGNRPGKTVAISIPRCVVQNLVSPADNNMVAGQTVTLSGLIDTGIATPTTGFEDLARSPLVISFL
jgi:hypothetical protein